MEMLFHEHRSGSHPFSLWRGPDRQKLMSEVESASDATRKAKAQKELDASNRQILLWFLAWFLGKSSIVVLCEDVSKTAVQAGSYCSSEEDAFHHGQTVQTTTSYMPRSPLPPRHLSVGSRREGGYTEFRSSRPAGRRVMTMGQASLRRLRPESIRVRHIPGDIAT